MKISGGNMQVKKCEKCDSVLSTDLVPEFKGKDSYQFFSVQSGLRIYGFHVAKDLYTGEIEVFFNPGVTLSKNDSKIDVMLKEGK